MDKTLGQPIIASLNAILQQKYINGEKEVDVKMINKYIKNRFGMDVDADLLGSILEKTPVVSRIENDKIVLGTKEEKEEENIDTDIHDTAVDQASSDLKNESVVDILSNKNLLGKRIKSRLIKLDESDTHYHLHRAAQMTNKTYIVCKIKPSRNINESFLSCKIDGSSLFVDIPVKKLLKK